MIKKLRKNNKGFTLIETLVYIALFTIILGGSLVTAYGIIENSDKTQAQVVLQEDANFLLRKLDSSITGASSITLPTTGSTGGTLIVTKPSGDIEFRLNTNKMQIKRGVGVYTDLNNDNVFVTNLSFQHIAGGAGLPESVTTIFTLSDNYKHNQTFTQTKFLKR